MITDPSGNPMTRRELLRRIGRLEQVAGIEPFVFDDGPARGVRTFRFRTGSGLSFDVVPDRGMDLSFAEHGGSHWPGSLRTVLSHRRSTNPRARAGSALSPAGFSSPAGSETSDLRAGAKGKNSASTVALPILPRPESPTTRPGTMKAASSKLEGRSGRQGFSVPTWFCGGVSPSESANHACGSRTK